MKKVFLRTLAMIFALMMILSAASCADNSSDEQTDNSVNTESDIEYPDMGGYEFVVLTEDCGFQHTAFDHEEYSGNVIENSLYTRNSLMEQDYNIVITENTVQLGTALDAIKNDILSQTFTYDLVFSLANHTFGLVAEGMFQDLNKVSELDLSASCWDQGAVRDLSVKNKLYCVTGDIHFGAFDMVSMFLYNYEMGETLKLKDARQLALDGSWTMEELKVMIANSASDVDNDSEYLDQSDRYGISSTTAMWTNIMIGGGVSFFTKNINDIPEFSAGSDRFSDVYDAMMNMVSSTNCYVPNIKTDADKAKVEGDTYRDVFNSGNALFMGGIVADLDDSRARESGIKYSPVPFPKYDKDQEAYASAVNFQVEVMYMPIGKDVEKVSVITQALCERSTDTLRAGYYEQCLKIQRVGESQDSELLDLIYDSRVYDIGLISLWGNVRATFNGDLAGKYSKTGLGYFARAYGSGAQKECEAFIEKLNTFDDASA